MARAELVPDPGFGTAGQATHTLPGRTQLDRPRVALLADGRIALTTIVRPDADGPPELAFLRLRPDGARDPDFAGGTAAFVALSPETAVYASLFSLLVEPDGSRTAVVRTSTLAASSRTLLVHVGAGGTDPGFNGGRPVELADDADVERVRIFASGDAFLIVGTAMASCCTNWQSGFRAWRVRRDGTPDATFGVGGRLDVAAAGAITEDAMPVPGGGFQVLLRSTTGEPRGTWRRYRADGSLDAAFGSGGEMPVPPIDGVGLYDVEPLGDDTYAGMSGTCLLRRLDAQGGTLRGYAGTCPLQGRNPRIQRYGGGFLVSGEERFDGTPPPTQGTYLWVLDANGMVDSAFAEPQRNRWRPPEPWSTASFDVAGDGGSSVLLAGRSDDDVIVFRYLDVRRGSADVPVPALGLPALLVMLVGMAMLARRASQLHTSPYLPLSPRHSLAGTTLMR